MYLKWVKLNNKGLINNYKQYYTPKFSNIKILPLTKYIFTIRRR